MSEIDIYTADHSQFGPLTLKSLTSTMEHCQRVLSPIQKRLERSLAELAEMQCPACGRKATVVNRGSGETVVVCRHQWNAIQTLSEGTKGVWVSSQSGLGVEVFEDGPRRF